MMVVAYVTAGVGIVLLVAVLLLVLPRLRRFSRAAAEMRTGLAEGAAALPALRSRRG
jgi:hypothetical protein